METAVVEPRYYSAVQVARLLRFSESRTLGLIRDGRIRAIRIGRSIRVSADAIREFENSFATSNGAQAASQGRKPVRNGSK
jgi:excisionase family DNA binding protein